GGVALQEAYPQIPPFVAYSFFGGLTRVKLAACNFQAPASCFRTCSQAPLLWVLPPSLDGIVSVYGPAAQAVEPSTSTRSILCSSFRPSLSSAARRSFSFASPATMPMTLISTASARHRPSTAETSPLLNAVKNFSIVAVASLGPSADAGTASSVESTIHVAARRRLI